MTSSSTSAPEAASEYLRRRGTAYGQLLRNEGLLRSEPNAADALWDRCMDDVGRIYLAAAEFASSRRGSNPDSRARVAPALVYAAYGGHRGVDVILPPDAYPRKRRDRSAGAPPRPKTPSSADAPK